MGGLTKALFGLAPVFAVALIFALQGRNDVQLQQERHRVQQREQAIVFDKQFDSAFRSIESELSTRTALDNQAESVDEELADTVKRRKQLDAEFDDRFRAAEAELDDAMQSLNEVQ